MTKIVRINTPEELLRLWAQVEPKMYGNLKGVLKCLDYGLVLATTENPTALCLISRMGNTGVLHAIPASMGRECMPIILEWGRGEGLVEITTTSEKFNGSNFRYFEKTLGFRRSATIFTIAL